MFYCQNGRVCVITVIEQQDKLGGQIILFYKFIVFTSRTYYFSLCHAK